MTKFGDVVDEYAMGLLRLLDKESDRGCVLVVSAYIEDAVKRALSAYCRSVSDVSDDELNKVFKDFESQFANLASCVRLCRALGLIDVQDQAILKDFGSWRNTFAHGMGDKTIERAGIDFLKPIESLVDISVEVAAIKEFSTRSMARHKFMVWATVVLAGFHALTLELDGTKEQPHSDDTKPQ